MPDKTPMGRFIKWWSIKWWSIKWWSIKVRSTKLLSFIVFAIISVSFVYGLAIANDNIRATLISVAAIASVTLYSNWQIKKREREARFFTEKQAAYKKFVDLVFDQAKNLGKNINQNKLENQMRDFVKDLTIWGNDEMIKTYYKFTSEEHTEPRNAVLKLDAILRTIRKDLGHDDSNLNTGELIGLMLTKEGKQDLKRLLRNLS